jgi:hypothetical protein
MSHLKVTNCVALSIFIVKKIAAVKVKICISSDIVDQTFPANQT